MSYPKLNDGWKTLPILTQFFQDSRRWQRGKKKELKVKIWIPIFPIFRDFNHYLVVKDVKHKSSVSILMEANYKLIRHIQDQLINQLLHYSLSTPKYTIYPHICATFSFTCSTLLKSPHAKCWWSFKCELQDILKSHKNAIVTTNLPCVHLVAANQKMVPTWTKTLWYQTWGIEDLCLCYSLHYLTPKLGHKSSAYYTLGITTPRHNSSTQRNFIYNVLETCSQWATPNLWTKSNKTTSFHPTRWYLLSFLYVPSLA